MPLVKEICQRCMSREPEGSGLQWEKGDENWFRKGLINCFYNHGTERGSLLPLDSDPPPCCEFKLEHTVLSQKTGEVT